MRIVVASVLLVCACKKAPSKETVAPKMATMKKLVVTPLPAVQKLLARAGVTVGDVDLQELNEAFASQSLVVQRELGVDGDRLNVALLRYILDLGLEVHFAREGLGITSPQDLDRQLTFFMTLDFTLRRDQDPGWQDFLKKLEI